MPFRLGLVATSIAFYAAAFPPWEWTGGAWIAVAPLWLALRGLRPGRAAACGLLWGVGSNFAIGFWVPGAIQFYYEQPPWFGWAFCFVATFLFWAPYYAGLAALVAWSRERLSPLLWCCLVGSVWVVAELCRANLLTGAPWLMFGYALVPYAWLRQAADVGGVYLLSFTVAFANAALVEAMLDRRWSGLGATAILLVLLGAYGAWSQARELPARRGVKVAVIQGNNREGAQWLPGAYAKGLDDYLRLSTRAIRESRPDVVVWPEAAVTLFFAHEKEAQTRVAEMLRAGDAELILGAPHFEAQDPALPRFLNSAFLFRPHPGIAGRYDKRHLMPFAEYFPLRTIELLRRRFERVRTFVPGTTATLLDTRFGKTAIAICFEAIFPDLVRRTMGQGADLLVNLSNDVWLGQGAGPEQHIPMIRLRAIENRTWVIRATTTGVSAIIDPYGNVVARSRTFESAVLSATVAPRRGDTFYQRYGDIFAFACLVATLLLSMMAARPRPA